MNGPKPAELGQPGVQFLQWSRFESIDPALRVDSARDGLTAARHSEAQGVSLIGSLCADEASVAFRGLCCI